jgi:hypothetical protein
VRQRHLGDEAVVAVPNVLLPLRPDPGEVAVCPDPESPSLFASMVLLSDPGEIDVLNAVLEVEIDE